MANDPLPRYRPQFLVRIVKTDLSTDDHSHKETIWENRLELIGGGYLELISGGYLSLIGGK